MKHKKTPAKVQKATPKARAHRDLDGLEVSINSFGEIQSNMNIEKINEFLNEKVEDKKLAERQDYDDLKKGRKKK